jgi:Retroviral aspartyl protease
LVPYKNNQHTTKWRNTFEQSRVLGLCHKCNDKYYSQHKYAVYTLNSIEGQNEKEGDSENESEKEELRDESLEIEEATMSMFNTCNTGAVRIMKFKGEIQKLPICALLDSGSTHSFVNPMVLRNNKKHMMQTLPIIVTVANGARMVTDQVCKALTFSIQGNQFERDMRI